MIKRDGDAEPLLESLLEFDPTPDTSWRALRAEAEIPVPINWEDGICVEVGSDGAMPVYDVRGVMTADKEVDICFMAFGNAKGNGPKLIHVYKDEEWNRERGILAGLGLDQSLMAGLEELSS